MTDSSPASAVHKTAQLARLSIGPAEEARLGAQFERILGAFQSLSKLDVADVPETTGGPRPAEAAFGRLRDDAPRPSLERAAALANAPQQDGEFYLVPKTVGGPT
ncbi:MAG: Asp-tRNA(Asn)/Glu-tRNA(Gln) amidotransferase subunit GatC [Planctomycetota bacterium]|nr:MAG: Asp-tRNA(Asn)/Glu-tRNA(Gln) amidotransferase subunit GatC [Planctomycetota bacterium]